MYENSEYLMKYIFSKFGREFQIKGRITYLSGQFTNIYLLYSYGWRSSPTDSYVQKDVKFHLCIVNLIVGKTKRFVAFQQHGKTSWGEGWPIKQLPDDGNNLAPCYDQRNILHIAFFILKNIGIIIMVWCHFCRPIHELATHKIPCGKEEPAPRGAQHMYEINKRLLKWSTKSVIRNARSLHARPAPAWPQLALPSSVLPLDLLKILWYAWHVFWVWQTLGNLFFIYNSWQNVISQD